MNARSFITGFRKLTFSLGLALLIPLYWISELKNKCWPHFLVFQALKEKTELQAQLATVNAQLQAKVEEAQASKKKQGTLTTEVGTLRQNCSQLEKAMVELQGSLENKSASLASLNNDLKVAEDQYNRLMGKVEEMQSTITSRDNTGVCDWVSERWV